MHSVDRAKVATLLDREEGEKGRRLPVFLEVLLGGEDSKHGFDPATLAAEARPLFGLPALEIAGLMTIPPFFEDPEDARPHFRRLRELRDRLAELPEAAGFRGLLSMGMSHDFEVAIAEGATHVRVGTALSATAKAEPALTELPSYTRRLFDGYAEADLSLPEHRPFLCERLLEEGDRADLRWLASQVAEDELRGFVRREGGRGGSPPAAAPSGSCCSCAAGAAGQDPAIPLGSELWPLA